jgi:hypothetical protein
MSMEAAWIIIAVIIGIPVVIGAGVILDFVAMWISSVKEGLGNCWRAIIG